MGADETLIVDETSGRLLDFYHGPVSVERETRRRRIGLLDGVVPMVLHWWRSMVFVKE